MSRSGDKVFKKCGDCNRLQSRVQRTLQKRGDLKDRWGVMSRDQRQQFFKEHHAAMGQDLTMLITQTTGMSLGRTRPASLVRTMVLSGNL